MIEGKTWNARRVVVIGKRKPDFPFASQPWFYAVSPGSIQLRVHPRHHFRCPGIDSLPELTFKQAQKAIKATRK